MKALYLIVVLSMFCANHSAIADDKAVPCRDSLPDAIRQMVETSYQGWHMASTEMLNQQDRERFKPFISKGCYGVIRGDFTSEGSSYALYMLKTKDNGYMDQLVVFQEDKGRVNQYILIPSSFVASAVILRKVRRRTSITDINTGKRFLPLHDVIDLFDPDKGEICFFWKAGKFISASTSE
jgi:hypothetical protein